MSGWCSCGKVWRYYIDRDTCPKCGAALQPSNFEYDIDPVTQMILPKRLPPFRGVRR